MKKKFPFLIFPAVFCVLILSVFAIEQFFDIKLYKLGVYPRTFFGLSGVFTAPLVHGDWEHLLSNLSALPVLTGLLTVIYRRNYVKIFTVLYLATDLAVWFLGRESYHIGASGIIYALASFLFFGGIISGRKGSAAVSLLTVMLYGSMVWGIFPTQEHISWESHALGSLVGFFSAFALVKEKPKKIPTDKDYDYFNGGFENFSQTANYDKISYGFKP